MNRQIAIIFFIIVCILFINIDISFAEEASEIDKGIISDIVRTFKEETDKWYDKIVSGARYMFSLALFFELAWASGKAALQQMSIQDYFINFVQVILAASFFWAVINHYQEWSQALVFGLQKFAGTLTTVYANDDNPFIIASQFYDLIEKKIDGLGIMSSAGLIIGLFIAGFIITICFSLITAKMIVIKCEVLVGMLASVLLIPFGASQTFKEFAINAIKYALSVGFKLFVLQLIIGVGYGFMDKLAQNFDPTLYNIFIVIAFSLVLLCLVFTLPDTIASLISSAHGTSGNMLMAMNTVMNTISAAAHVAGPPLNATKATGMGIVKAPFQFAAAKSLARDSMLEMDSSNNYTDTSKWNDLSKFGKTKAIYGVWNEARKQANANNSTIYKEIKNNQIMLQNARAYA